MTETNEHQDHVGRTEADASFEQGQIAAKGEDLGFGLHAFHGPSGVTIVDEVVEVEKRGARLLGRKAGHHRVQTPDSFIEYLARHATSKTEVWADEEGQKVVAVIDGDERAEAGRQEHTITLAVKHSPEWTAWNERSGKFMGQAEFAEFIEQHAGDVRVPDAATLMEIAQTITGHRNVQFEAGQRVSDGSIQFAWHEETNAKAGKSGHLEIPERLSLGIRPFIAGTKYEIDAGLRWRVQSGTGAVVLALVLIDPATVLEDAFQEYLVTIREGLDKRVSEAAGGAVPIYTGTV